MSGSVKAFTEGLAEGRPLPGMRGTTSDDWPRSAGFYFLFLACLHVLVVSASTSAAATASFTGIRL